MKVCIVGAGAIGAWIGVKLARAGCEVSVLARGATLEAVRQHGLRLEPARAEPGPASAAAIETAPVRANGAAAELGVQDLVVIAVKAPAMDGVAQSIAPLLVPRRWCSRR